MAYFHCLIGGGSSGGGYELTVTCDADFAGTTITATDGVTTLTQTCPSASPYVVVFAIPNGGEWTVSGVIGGATYTASIDIPDSLELHSIPEGSTVLPTDDIYIWLKCAGITDKSYTTLNEVLADSTTLLALMSDDNAVDYLVRSTTWASGITADSTAMTDIGANNYCANTLLSDSTWRNAICNSTYFENVLNVKVPTMTSATTPSGEVIAPNQHQNYRGYYAFDRNTSTRYSPVSANTFPDFVTYDFKKSVKIFKFSVMAGTTGSIKNFQIRGSNDNNVWESLYSGTYPNSQAVIEDVLTTIGDYRYYQIYQAETGYVNYLSVAELQFYGREDV